MSKYASTLKGVQKTFFISGGKVLRVRVKSMQDYLDNFFQICAKNVTTKENKIIEKKQNYSNFSELKYNIMRCRSFSSIDLRFILFIANRIKSKASKSLLRKNSQNYSAKKQPKGALGRLKCFSFIFSRKNITSHIRSKEN